MGPLSDYSEFNVPLEARLNGPHAGNHYNCTLSRPCFALLSGDTFMATNGLAAVEAG
jgi:hypothetical protein